MRGSNQATVVQCTKEFFRVASFEILKSRRPQKHMNKDDYESYLRRVHDGCLFHLKGNALALASLVALAGALRLEKLEILKYVSSIGWIIVLNGLIIATGLYLEAMITTARPSHNRLENSKQAISLRRTYKLYVILEFVSLCLFIGWTAGFLNIF
jgi:hypothetical protein